jgi:predicted HAD superfamily Cof-like phosphohydrolase
MVEVQAEYGTTLTNHEDVGEFHRKFNLRHTNDGAAGPAPQDLLLLSFRLNFLLEELSELVEAVGAKFYTRDGVGPDGVIQSLAITVPADVDQIDHAQAFDALIDLNYVSHGTAHLLGYPWQEGWDAVQAANMAKERATSAEASKRGSAFDVIKPEGWKPPDIGAVLRSHGFFKHGVECPVCGGSFDDPGVTCEPGICRAGG